ncbi:related to Vacuolar protein sorting/targeting protein 10 [Hanseniaspora guilliermondii]|uniref:Related to Vacuolar protein sorting/targeting protein 10 n=1 Tax=Hanseniaspora guilliermondii TaxID=56406 RepID=A0A1L0AU56_9ASCO|nr:related to Vacuolar protein sorting/targeting protein 10 [Hanseniaspora guilliermondii]
MAKLIWLLCLSFVFLSSIINANNENNFIPKVRRIDTLIDSSVDHHKGPDKHKMIRGGFSNRIIRFDDSHQLLSLGKGFELKYSSNAGESWDNSNLPKQVKSMKDFSKQELKQWEDTVMNKNYFIPSGIAKDFFHSDKRTFILQSRLHNGFLVTENKGASFDLISMKGYIDNAVKKLLSKKSKINFTSFELEDYYLDTIYTNSDYNNILVNYYITLTDKSNESDNFIGFSLQVSFISKNRGKSFTFVDAQSDDFFSTQCEFLDKETGDKVSTSDLYCLQKAYEFVESPESFPVIEETKSQLIRSSNLGQSFEVVDEMKDFYISWLSINYPYILAYVSKDRYNINGEQELYISNDQGKTFKKAIIPTETNSKDEDHFVFAVPQDDIIVLIENTYKREADDSSNDGNVFLGLREHVYISDSSGLRFSAVEDRLKDSSKTNNDDLYTYVDRLFNFKGILTLSRQKMDFSKDTKEGALELLIEPGLISFDDGGSWDTFNVKNDEDFICNPESSNDCNLRLIFGSSEVVSQIYGINVGDRLMTPGIASIRGIISDKSIIDSDLVDQNTMTFITRDFGKTWEKAFDHEVYFAYGDYGNIIIGVHGDPNSDGDFVQEFYYSLDQGHTWKEYELKEESGEDGLLFWSDIKPLVLDGSGFQFIASGYKADGSSLNTDYHYIIDFTDAFDKKTCKDDDLEVIKLNSDKCIDGKSYSYTKRKPTSECLLRTEFKDLDPMIDICECTEDDFECEAEFVKDSNGNCILDKALVTESGICLKDKSSTIDLPVKRLKFNNVCKNSNKFNIDKETLKCEQLGISKGDDKIIVHDMLEFDGKVVKYQYFNTWEKNSILVRTEVGSLYVSTDAGITFKKFNSLEKGEKIVEVLFNKFFGKIAYILTSNNNVFVTDNAGETFIKHSDAIPADSIQLAFPLDVNAKDSSKLIYYGGSNCESIFNKDCHANAYISRDSGKTFTTLLDNAVHCEFLGSTLPDADDDLIVCEVKHKDQQYSSIVASTDYFQNDKKIIYEANSLGFVSYKNFTVFAIVEEENLRAFITMDGKEYAGVQLPKRFNDFNQRSFTIAGSTAGSVIMHLTTEMTNDMEYGALLKSNYNGTSFVTIENSVNRDGHGFIDFEYVGGLEGVFITNVVTNPGSKPKKLKTKISYNDGGIFRYLTPPVKSFKGDKYACNGQGLEKCSLNLHGFTERHDIRDTLTSGAGVGLLIGIGNVGETLLPYEQCATYLSTDGGISWKEISDKPYQYEFGDRGNLLVLASYEKTDSILYSRDQGKTWKTLKISDEPIIIHDLITNPTDSSLNFVLICSDFTIAIDFKSLYERQCSTDNADDFAYKAVQHPDSKCIFGHEMDYIYKKNTECYVGMAPLENKYKITKNCACTRDDYECDYNYELSESGVCKLVEGLSPLDPWEMCAKNPDLVEVFHPTGYRKISLSTCEGGKTLDKPSSLPQACPGKESEFKKLHSVSSIKSGFFVMMSLALMIATLWILYDRGIKRNGGFSRFGEIRLSDDHEDDGIIEENFADVIINRIVSVGVIGFFGLSNIYRKISKPTANIFRKAANVFGIRRQGFRNPEYFSVPTDNAYNTFEDDSMDDDLLFGNDADANDLSALNDEDINFDVDEVDSFTPYTDNTNNDDSNEQSNA